MDGIRAFFRKRKEMKMKLEKDARDVENKLHRMIVLNELENNGPVIIDDKGKEVMLIFQTPEGKTSAIEFDSVMDRYEWHLRGGYTMLVSPCFLEDLMEAISKAKIHHRSR